MVVLLVGWHIWLGRLSYKTIVEDDGKVESSWGRILGRIVVPLLLLSFGVYFGIQVFGRMVSPIPYVTGNVNDAKEVERELGDGL